MRVIKSDTGYVAYQKIFKYLQAHSTNLVSWQHIPETGTRQVLHSILSSYHLDSGLLHFSLGDQFSFKDSLPLYFYAEEGKLIFKSQLKDVRSGIFTVEVPKEVKLLDEQDVSAIKGSTGLDLSTVWKSKKLEGVDIDNAPDYLVVKSMAERSARDKEFLDHEFSSVSLDEEEKMFADKRETPRARPKKEKSVKVRSELTHDEHVLKLFDLSQGGMAFTTRKPDLFPKGSKVIVLGFEDFNLDDPLIAQVMSHRQMDASPDFKIGCKFDEGQS